ncbi:MAG: DUF4249 domain-containing protein [Bacteroidaceae bacterium]|nr:DUF4249 domain-containing protein [Bacteroidaceae bacterium]
MKKIYRSLLSLASRKAFGLWGFLAAGMLLLTTASCEKEIDYHGPDEKPLLVVNLVAQAGAPVSVDVSHSVFFLSISDKSETLKLKDAKVVLTVNGKSETVAYDAETGTYDDTRVLHEGDEVTVVATHPTYGTASATMTVPRAAGITISSRETPYDEYRQDTLDTNYSYYWGMPAIRIDSIWRVTFDIQDTQETGFYRLTIDPTFLFQVTEGCGMSALQYEYRDSEMLDDDTYAFLCNGYYSMPTTTGYALGENDIEDIDLSFFGLDGGDEGYSVMYSPSTYVFSSENARSEGSGAIAFDFYLQTPGWNGGNYYYYHPDEHFYSYATLYYGGYGYYGDEEEESEGEMSDLGNPWDIVGRDFVYAVNVTLETLTPEYYYYLKSVQKYGNTTWSPFSEPVQVTCNVDGGIGIVGATSARTLTFVHHYTFTE